MKILAAVSDGSSAHPSLEELELAGPREDEVLVRIVASGICHTDLRAHAALGPPTPRPLVLGHEGAGIVERVGAGVGSLAAGDHVVLSGASCGSCRSCIDNLPSYCTQNMQLNFGARRADGSSALSRAGATVAGHFFGQSSFAQYSVVNERTCVPVPRDLPLAILAPLGCGVITGTGAVINSLQLRAGMSLAVFGVGGVGLSAVMAAKLVGAAPVVAIDVVAPRLELALELGATHALDARDPELVGRLRALGEHGEGLDASLNTTGTPEVFTQAVACLTMRGTAGFVTAPRGEWPAPMFALLAGGRRLRGILGGDAAPRTFIPMLIAQHRRGRLPLERLVREYEFAELPQAFADMQRGATVKPVLRISPG